MENTPTNDIRRCVMAGLVGSQEDKDDFGIDIHFDKPVQVIIKNVFKQNKCSVNKDVIGDVSSDRLLLRCVENLKATEAEDNTEFRWKIGKKDKSFQDICTISVEDLDEEADEEADTFKLPHFTILKEKRPNIKKETLGLTEKRPFLQLSTI